MDPKVGMVVQYAINASEYRPLLILAVMNQVEPFQPAVVNGILFLDWQDVHTVPSQEGIALSSCMVNLRSAKKGDHVGEWRFIE